MLTFYGSTTTGPIAADPDGGIPGAASWIDAVTPTADERQAMERAMGARVPSLEDLSEVESSSRLSVEGSTFFMSLPATVRDGSNFPRTTPIGFVLNGDRLATVRFARLPSFEHLARDACAKGQLGQGGLGALVSLLEMIVDQVADTLERIGSELDTMSHQVFTTGLAPGADRKPQRSNKILSDMLGTVGRNGEFISKVSESLLGLSRIGPFLDGKAQALMTPDLRARLDTVHRDAESLREYDEHLSSRTQFLLDTLLGLANIEQNNVFRVLTVVSVIGIPPTFFASLYGMNFKNMPELNWTYGYPYGLTLIILSGLLPAIWFKAKGWW